MHSTKILSELLINNFSMKADEVVAIKIYPSRIDFDKKINSEQEVSSETIINREEINDFLSGKFVSCLSEHGMEMDYCPDAEDLSKHECNRRRFLIFTKDWIIIKRTKSNCDIQPMVTENFLEIIPRNY